MSLVYPQLTLIKMYLNETYCEVRTRKRLSATFLIQNSLKQGDALQTLLFNFSSEHAIRGSKNTKWG
jgi:hypothetical protein